MEKMIRHLRSYVAAFLLLIGAPLMLAYDPDNFLEEYRAEGFDMTFNDQHENIFLFIVGVILLGITFTSKIRGNKGVARYAGVAIIVFSAVNMMLGVPYDENIIFFLGLLLVVCLIVTLAFKKKLGGGNVFFSAIIFIGAIFLSVMIDEIDYIICDKQNQYPPEYGLQWRPYSQGFTDKNYFNSVEQKVDPRDSSRILYNLLNDEVHSFEYPFDFLKQKGWQINQIGPNGRIFINPEKTLGYIQSLCGGGLEPISCTVSELKDCFPSLSADNIVEVRQLEDVDDIIVVTTEENDSIKLYLKNFTHDWFNDFTNLKDSVLLLDDSEITNIISPNSNTYTLNENFYEVSNSLSFPKDTIEHIYFEGQVIRVRFKNPQAKDKVYSNNCMTFVDSEEKLRRF